MFGKFIHFIKYNNAFTLTVAGVFLAAGGAFAATNPEVFVETTETVSGVDNTYLVNLDLGTFNPTMTISEITEDDDTYYVKYRLSTIDLEGGTWRNVIKDRELKVSKRLLGTADLARYVMEELGEIVAHERSYMAKVQDIETANGPTQKTVATTYSGLIGKFLSANVQVFPGYEPPPPPPPQPHVDTPEVVQADVPPIPEPEPQPAPTPEPEPIPVEEQPAPQPEPPPTPAPQPAPTPDAPLPVEEPAAPAPDPAASSTPPVEETPAEEPPPIELPAAPPSGDTGTTTSPA